MLYCHKQRPRLAERREFLGRSRARTNTVAGKVKFEAQTNSRLAWMRTAGRHVPILKLPNPSQRK